MNPTNDETLHKALGDDGYQAVFPFGVSRNPVGGMFAAWERDLWRLRGEAPIVGDAVKSLPEWLGGSTDADMMRTSVDFLANNIAEWDKAGGNGPMPSIEDAVKDARAFYAVDMAMKFGDSFSTQHPVPGQMMRDAWNQLRSQYGADTVAARDAFMKQWGGDWAQWYTYSSSDYSAYLPATTDAYNRIFRDFPDLTKSIVAKSGDDPSMVSLLALGTGSGPFSQSVYDYYKDTPLPGDNVPIAGKIGPDKWLAQVQVQQGRELYSKRLAVVNATLTQLRTQRDQQGISTEARDAARSKIDSVSKYWDQQVVQMEDANEPWKLSRTEGYTDRPARAAATLDMALSNKGFAGAVANEPVWQGVERFLKLRDGVLAAKAAIPSAGLTNPDGSHVSHDDAVNAMKDAFTDYVSKNLLPTNPDFQPVWDSYFADEWSTQK